MKTRKSHNLTDEIPRRAEQMQKPSRVENSIEKKIPARKHSWTFVDRNLRTKRRLGEIIDKVIYF